MKKLCFFLFCGLLFLTGCTKDEPTIASGTAGKLTWKLLENGTLVISGKGEMPDYEYSGEYSPWYEYRSDIINIIIGNDVRKIGNYAFYGYNGLKQVTIGNSVTSIGSWAFGDSGIIIIAIGNSVTTIKDNAFSYCSSLTTVTIGNSLTTIGSNIFLYCNSLTSINVDNGNTAYSSEDGVLFNKAKTTLLEYPTGKVGDYTIPNSVTTIGSYAFAGCRGLTTVTIGNSVTTIRNDAFRECANLKSVTIPNSVTSIGHGAFIGCVDLTSITIPNSVTSIGFSAFLDCKGLTSINVDNNNTAYCSEDGVLFNKTKTTLEQFPSGKTGTYTIPNSVTSIGYGAFWNSTGLTSITIGNSVTSIESTFHGSSSLTSINVDNGNTTYSSEDGVLFNKTKTTLIEYPKGKKGTYSIPNSVISIGDGAFGDCLALASITIPNSVTSIGTSAFFYCTNLTSVTIPNSVTDIGFQAFLGCRNLIEIINERTVPQRLDLLYGFGVFHNINLSACTLRVPAASIAAYRTAEGWKDFGNIVAIQ